jgi:protein SCO1/2
MPYRVTLPSLCLCVAVLVPLREGHASLNLAQARSTDSPGADGAATYRGGIVTPPLPKPRFTLVDTSGARFDFWQQTHGYVTLLFFGYARCPDQCPLHMSSIASGMKKLPVAVRDQIKLVFVTTDPARDSPQLMRAWLNQFDKRFIGLTGSEAAIEAAQRAAGVPLATRMVTTAAENYSVGHANFVVAYTKDNLAHVIYPGGVTQNDWLHDLPQLVQETWPIRAVE